jgi:hypothetical protein
MEGFKSLKEGQRVNLDLVEGEKGFLAVRIQAEQTTPEAIQPGTDDPSP